MEYSDRIYGNVKIDLPVILELINCPTIQRLRGIDQSGYFTPFFPGAELSRFEHSAGVCSLLKIFGAPAEEQVAGLIHDASHAVFSHCIDYVLDAGSPAEQNYQDNVFDRFIRRSEIPAILKKYAIDPEYILEDTNFPLKETDLPDLCADRIDYALRAARVFGEIERADYFLKNLEVKNKQWFFKNYESGRAFAELFAKLNRKYFAGLASAVMFAAVGGYLRRAIEKDYINESDLYLTDREVLDKISGFHGRDGKLANFFDRMNNRVGFENDPDNYDIKVVCKSRAVDPLCLENGAARRVSEIDNGWKKILEIESKPKTYFIKFIRPTD